MITFPEGRESRIIASVWRLKVGGKGGGGGGGGGGENAFPVTR